MPRWWRILAAGCLVLFPLLFIVFAGTDIHPDHRERRRSRSGRWPPPSGTGPQS
jgi:hypothetical protein